MTQRRHLELANPEILEFLLAMVLQVGEVGKSVQSQVYQVQGSFDQVSFDQADGLAVPLSALCLLCRKELVMQEPLSPSVSFPASAMHQELLQYQLSAKSLVLRAWAVEMCRH